MSRSRELKLKAREEGFNLGNLGASKKTDYNALYDPNMRHYFENSKIQKFLLKTGQIDHHGRVIDLEKNKSKIHILEREFTEAEKIEEKRQKEEMEMRYRVQRKRFNDLEMARKEDLLRKMKHDKDFGKEVISIVRSTTLSQSGRESLSRRPSPEQAGSWSGFFVTDNGDA